MQVTLERLREVFQEIPDVAAELDRAQIRAIRVEPFDISQNVFGTDAIEHLARIVEAEQAEAKASAIRRLRETARVLQDDFNRRFATGAQPDSGRRFRL
jgi:hypothetical protein